MALTEKLTAVANAIREKTGKEDKLTLDAMPVEIRAIETGGGDLPEEAFTITGNLDYRFMNGSWDWFIENYSSRATTSNLEGGKSAFQHSKVTTIPFDLNYKTTTSAHTISYMFSNCQNLTTLPNINNLRVYDTDCLLYNCKHLKEIPEGFYKNWDFSYLEGQTSAYNGKQDEMFSGCCSLRKVPNELIRSGNKALTSASSVYFSYGFFSCCALDELVDLPLFYTSEWTSNVFGNTFKVCTRLKRLTFETNADGTPKVMKWKGQTIDLSEYVGYTGVDYKSRITDYTQYTGIKESDNASKAVDNQDFEENYRNNENWWASSAEYSRYNRESAIETINSLPDTSAYLASKGGTNTIKFYPSSGSAYKCTDGSSGRIDKLTAEEIAVATAKGWTVAFNTTTKN